MSYGAKYCPMQGCCKYFTGIKLNNLPEADTVKYGKMFIEAKCDEHPQARVRASKLYDVFQKFLEDDCSLEDKKRKSIKKKYFFRIHKESWVSHGRCW